MSARLKDELFRRRLLFATSTSSSSSSSRSEISATSKNNKRLLLLLLLLPLSRRKFSTIIVFSPYREINLTERNLITNLLVKKLCFKGLDLIPPRKKSIKMQKQTRFCCPKVTEQKQLSIISNKHWDTLYRWKQWIFKHIQGVSKFVSNIHTLRHGWVSSLFYYLGFEHIRVLGQDTRSSSLILIKGVAAISRLFVTPLWYNDTPLLLSVTCSNARRF